MKTNMVLNGVEMDSEMTVRDGRNVTWLSKSDLKGKVRILGHEFADIWKAFDQGIAGRTNDEWLVLNWMLYVLWKRCSSEVSFWSLLGKQRDKVVVFSSKDKEMGCTNKEMDVQSRQIRKAIDEKYAGQTDEDALQAKKKEIDWELTNLACGTWTGKNKMGKLLKICSNCIKTKTQPAIDYMYFDKVGINWFGIRVSFKKLYDYTQRITPDMVNKLNPNDNN